jgi:hypothetical protein
MVADSGKDRLGAKLHDLEQAREDIFFAERDRKLIEKLRAEGSGHWRAEVVDLMALVQAVAGGSVPLSALQANQPFLDQEAARDQQALALPGVRPVHDDPAT